MKRISKSKMDAVDTQQQDEIDYLKKMVWFVVYVFFVMCFLFAAIYVTTARQFSNVVDKIKVIEIER